MAAGKTPESKRWILGILPRQRPKEEWEHVYVTRNGGRYVDVEELFARKSVQKDLAKMKKLGEEERRRNSARTALNESRNLVVSGAGRLFGTPV